jgi:RNA polymerase sigma-70 factor (ECF subfamily)
MTVTPINRTVSVTDAAFIACIPHMRAFAKILTGNDGSADDLVEAAIRRARTLPAPALTASGLKRWMFTLLHVLHYGGLHGTDAHAPPDHNAPALRQRHDADNFAGAFWQLRDDQREALILQAAAGLSRGDAASVYGGPLGTVDMRALRARQHLETLLHADAQTERAGAAAMADAGWRPGSLAAANLA